MCVRIGGFHTRYTAALRGRPHPGIVQVFLDGDGPLGDSYSVNSAVSGPYGDATVQELLPVIEKRFDCGGAANRRFTTGGSTGGWVSLALQIYYPDTFGGCWSGYPDSLDFRAYQNIDLYRDANAYTAPDGSERVSARDARTGATRWTVREECALENVRGTGGSYTTSGGQWGAWNAVYGSPDKNGRPIPFWDPVSGVIDRAAVSNAGKRYDLRRYCAANWETLAPKLDGKIHVWVGERDEYFLNGGVHRFDDFLKTASPRIRARIEYSPVAGHGWEPRSRAAVLDEMIAAASKR
jgi:S-formylglutathione hydrolase FrmB